MKKRLLFAVLAMMCAATSFAFEVGEYVYTSSQRLKIEGANLAAGGESLLSGWTAADRSEWPSETWQIVDGEYVQSLGATGSLCRDFTVTPGSYVVSYEMKYTTVVTTSVTASQGNYCDVFLSKTGTLDKADGDISVATTQNINDDWKTISYFVTVENDTIREEGSEDYRIECPKIVMHFNNLAEGMCLRNFTVQSAIEVYDIRPLQKKMAQARTLMELDYFNIDDAEDDYYALQETLDGIEGRIAMTGLENASQGAAMLTQLEETLEFFLAWSSVRMNSKLVGTDNVASIAGVGRGRDWPANSISNLELTGGNWGHISGEDCIKTAIQSGGSFTNSGSYNVFNKEFPAGDYFFALEIRNANTGKSSWPCEYTFNLETICQVYIGNDTIDTDPVVGEEYQWFFMKAHVDEDGTFRAGVIWPGASSGGAFFVRNVEVRAFNLEILDQLNRKDVYATYKTQWDAATNARKGVEEKVGARNYPWDQATLTDALATWNPVYDAHKALGWEDENGNDTGVATNEELEDWAKYQGGEIPEDGKATYQLVRGYQNASNAVVTTNKPIADFQAAIAAAEATRDDAMNVEGDKETFQKAIDAAQALLDNVLDTTNDDTRVADSLRLAQQTEVLAAAVEVFMKSAELAPIVDIDFSNTFYAVTDEELGTTQYFIDGKAGKMEFGTDVNIEDNSTDNMNFELGHGDQLLDVLHVGGGSLAKVQLPEVPTENDVLRVNFDLWLGNLSKGFLDVVLLNANGARVAGFSIDRYNGDVAYNDFNDVIGKTNGGKGMDIRQYCSGLGSSQVGNVQICVDANKSSFTLNIDYKAQTIAGTVVNAKNGTCVGEPLALVTPADGDNIITTFAIGCDGNDGSQTYAKANSGAGARRCWFDNLQIFKFTSTAEGPDGIASVAVATAANNDVYTLSGVKMGNVKNLQKGLYIINGKKYLVK